jgi:hypothetical protein
MPKGNIYNISNMVSSTPACDDHKSWDELPNCFSERVTKMIIQNYTKDSRIGKALESAFGWQRHIEGKFRRIHIYAKGAKAFINIKTKAIEALSIFMHSKNCKQFASVWSSCSDELSSIRNNANEI